MILHTRTCDADGHWDAPFPDLDSPATLVLVFGHSDLIDRPGPIEDLRAAFPTSCLVGCSTSGQILENSIADAGAVVTIAKFQSPGVRLAVAADRCSDGPLIAGRSLANQLADDDLRGVFILSEGLSINGSLLARGLRDALPDHVPATGGLAGDGERFKRTWICSNGEIFTSGVVAVGFYGDSIRFHHGCRGGWDPFGPARIITRSEGNTLYELDGKPALELYERYLGDKAADLPASALLYPLAIHPPNDDRPLVRTILNINRDDGALIFAGDMPEGWTAQLMQGDFDHVIDGAGAAAGMLPLDQLDDRPALCLAISCVGRRLILRHRAEDELEELRHSLPDRVATVGFYSYGELSPIVGSTCELHNQTMTLTMISEEQSAQDAPAAAA